MNRYVALLIVLMSIPLAAQQPPKAPAAPQAQPRRRRQPRRLHHHLRFRPWTLNRAANLSIFD